MQNFGGGDLVEIALSAGKTVMVPFTLAAIPEIAVRDGFVRVDSLAAGLVGTGEEDGEDGA